LSKALEGHIAVVTGASKGLGRQMAETLAAGGAAVALVARNAELLDKVVAVIREKGGTAEAIIADVHDEGAVAEAAQQVKDRLGVCDILVNNAGINNRKSIEDFTLAEWNEILGVNLTGPFLCSRAFVPGMKAKKWGRIINMTSIMTHISLPNRTGYSTTKAGLLGFTKALALELAPHGVTVNGISPGPFATEMNQPIIQNADLNKQFVAKIPMGRWGELHEVGQLALYLCSPEAGFITGTDVLIDGGWTAQ
jgi:NAD(P)-dependent dehydrogenase (short-subunit alcohol dehydrogenase family)